MTTLHKILLAASATLFLASLTETGGEIAWGFLKPLSAVLFIVFFIVPLWVLLPTVGGAPTVLHGFTPEQVQSIALVLLKVNASGAATAMAFFGVSVPLYGYLIFRSNFLPRWLGR